MTALRRSSASSFRRARPALTALLVASAGAAALTSLPARANETIDWVSQVQASATSQKTRAEVVAETAEARRAGLLDRWNEGYSPSLAVPATVTATSAPRDRAEVRAEARMVARDWQATRSEQPTITSPAEAQAATMVGRAPTQDGSGE